MALYIRGWRGNEIRLFKRLLHLGLVTSREMKIFLYTSTGLYYCNGMLSVCLPVPRL